VAAGLLLYLLAALPPYLLCAWLAATPGHFNSPFTPPMMLAGIADIFTGLAYYFAALALALQRDTWAGLRALPVLAAFHCSTYVTSVPFFRAAMVAAALMGIALFVAGWGTMLNQERFGGRPLLARIACLAMLYYGVCGLGDIAKSIVNVIGPDRHSRFYRYILTQSGEPVRVTYVDDVCVSVTDPDGHPVTGKNDQPSRIGTHQHYTNGVSSYIGDSHGWKGNSYLPDYRDARSYIEWMNLPWFYLIKDRSFVGFEGNKMTARLDARGFQPPEATPQPFPTGMSFENLQPAYLFIWDGNTFTFNAPLRRESKILPLPARGPVYGMVEEFYNDSTGQAIVLAVALADRMAVYDTSGAVVTTLPYHRDVDRWGELEMGVNGAMDRFYMWYQPSAWIDGATRAAMPSYIEETDRQGNTLRSWTLPPLPSDYQSQTPANYLAQHIQSPAFYFGLMTYRKIGASLGSQRLAGLFERHYVQDHRPAMELALCSAILGLVMAAVAWFWARSAHLPRARAGAWALFVFLFGIAGLIVFRLAAGWPRVVACPLCHQPRPIERDRCPACKSGWPEPQPLGTEVFDGGPRVPAAT
jgi:hypothetical protein